MKARRKVTGWCFECEVNKIRISINNTTGYPACFEIDITDDDNVVGAKDKLRNETCICGKQCKPVKVEITLGVKRLTK